jgi:Putative  PD-(D/E)XK family member, (DUF4420)
MTPLRAEMISKWAEASLANRSDREWRGISLSVQAPVRFLAGIREPDGHIALLLEAPLSAAPRSVLRINADGVTLSDQRAHGESIVRIAVTLERESLRDVFEVLATDIVEVVRPTTTPSQAISAAVSRLEAWQAFLRSGGRGLSREEQIGLLGELAVLRLVAAEIGYDHAVGAWIGPLDGIHDFNRSGIAIEVKGVAGVGSLLRISHLDQLETRGLSALVIARPRFREGPEGSSLSDVIQSIREEIDRSAPNARTGFDDRLLRARFLDVDRQQHDSITYLLHSVYGFEVREGFPRLTTSSVPAEIVDAAYSLDERTIDRFRIEADGLSKFASMMTDAKI